MPGLQLVAQVPAGLGNDLESSLHKPSLTPVVLESIKRDACRFIANVLDCLDDIGEPRNERRQYNTRNAEASIRSRKTGCKLARVMISALHSRILAVNFFTSISRKRPSPPLS